ncbi:MAG: putative GTP-binding protein EngB [Chlamydiae bacterium]|nr:putative GTP-binding protein EngB [Chlamydiota bacterium]
MFTKPEFILSASDAAGFPELNVPEIAVVGRSNVGKSSLINHLTQSRKLARVSSVPGKTQLINFFTLDGQLTLVDLPGYGFAKVPKNIRHKWGDLIASYLENRPRLGLILLLCDSRHPPTNDDVQFAKWAIHYKKNLLIVFTKADKLKPGAVERQCRKHFDLLSEAINDTSIGQITYSIKNAKSRLFLIKEIEKRIK